MPRSRSTAKTHTHPLLQILGSNNLERSISVLIYGVHYDYYFHGSVEDYLYNIRLIMKHSQGAAIKALKRYSWKCERITK